MLLTQNRVELLGFSIGDVKPSGLGVSCLQLPYSSCVLSNKIYG
jgi:hypothetical protein